MRSISASSRPRRAEGDVLLHRRREEERILRDDADLAAERRELHVADVDVVQQDLPRGHVVEPWDERRESRLARAGVPDQRDRAARFDLEIDRFEDGPAVHVLEADVVEAEPAAAGRKVDRAGSIRDLLRLVEDLEDALARRGRALSLSNPHAERTQRHDQHSRVEVERDETADGQFPVRPPCAQPTSSTAPCASIGTHEMNGTYSARCRLARNVCWNTASERSSELFLFLRLLRERLDDVHADDVLLGHRGDVGELLLHVAKRRMCDVAVPVRDHPRGSE